jgi:hypothetical protein
MQAGRSLVVAGAVTAAGNVPGCAMSPPHAGGLARAEPQDGNNAWHYAATTEGEFSMARRPNTLRELLTNLKVASDRGLLLREDFYTEENLKVFSGGNEVLWVARSPTRQQATITGFDGMLPPVRVGNNTFAGITYSIGRDVLESGRIQANVHVSLMEPNPGVTFDSVEGVFGRNWQEFPFFPAPPGRKFGPPTRPHGNDRIRYDFGDNRESRSVVMEFHADGTLYNMTLSEEMK